MSASSSDAGSRSHIKRVSRLCKGSAYDSPKNFDRGKGIVRILLMSKVISAFFGIYRPVTRVPTDRKHI